MTSTFLAAHSEILIQAIKIIKSGSLSVETAGKVIVKIGATTDEIVVDLENLEAVKGLLKSFRKQETVSVDDERREETSILEQMKTMKGFAEKLRDKKTTITISRFGETVLILGEKARPIISRLILGNSIEANVLEILSIVRALR